MSCQNSSRSCNITFNEKTIKAILGYNLFSKLPLPITEASSVSLSVEFTFPTNHFYAAVCICLFCTHICVVRWYSYLRSTAEICYRSSASAFTNAHSCESQVWSKKQHKLENTYLHFPFAPSISSSTFVVEKET